MARRLVLTAALVGLLAPVSGAGGAPEQTPKRGGTVVFGTYREPGCLNAYLVRCGSSLTPVGIVSSLALRGPFRIGAGSSYEPDLVSRVDFTRTPPFTLTYHIRKAARWSDDTPVTARDFVFTYTTIRSARQEMWEPEVAGYEFVRAVRAIDAKTVRVVLRARYAGWRGLFPRLLPEHALRGANFSTVWSDGIHNPRTGRPIGSGPFLVERWERGRAVTFVRNPRYWRGPAHLDRIVVRFCLQCSPLAAEQVEWLRSETLDVLSSVVLDGEQIRELRRFPGLQVRAPPGPSWEHIDVRVGAGGHPSLKRKLVRRAVAYGIDRVAVARAVYGRVDPRYPPSDSAVYPVANPRYRPNWQMYRFRPAEARRLLEQEGCRRGPDGVYVCEGGRLSLRMATIAGEPRRRLELETIERQLRQVGIEIVPVYAPTGPLFDQIIPRGSFDLALFSYLRFPDSPGTTFDVYGCGGTQNYAGYCQRIVSRDLDQARRILDASQQARVLHRADAQLAKDVPVIPLLQHPFTAANRTTVRNVAITSFFDPFTNAEKWWLDD